jgi:hypothetical protein
LWGGRDTGLKQIGFAAVTSRLDVGPSAPVGCEGSNPVGILAKAGEQHRSRLQLTERPLIAKHAESILARRGHCNAKGNCDRHPRRLQSGDHKGWHGCGCVDAPAGPRPLCLQRQLGAVQGLEAETLKADRGRSSQYKDHWQCGDRVSLNPNKDFKAFSHESDIDVAVISEHHFAISWRALRTLKLPDARNYKDREAIKEHRTNHIYWGTIATDRVLHYLPFVRPWTEALAAMAGESPTEEREIKIRLYRDYEALRSYHMSGLETLAATLMAS